MALFGKGDAVGTLLKQVEAADGSTDVAELDFLLDVLFRHADFKLEEEAWMFSHANRRVRERAAKSFLAFSDPKLTDLLIQEMPSKPAGLRQELARLIAQAAGPRLPARLGAMVHSRSLEQRRAAVEIIAQSDKWQELLPHLKVTAHDADSAIRHATVRLLSRDLENPAIFLLLRDLIHDEDETIRSIVIRAFARDPEADVVEPFFERLPLEGPGERAIMVHALGDLARRGQEKVEGRILPMLADENPEIREVAVELLAQMPDRTRVIRAFLIHCQGLAFWLRERSLQSIRLLSGDLVESLVTLMDDECEDVRVGAMLLASGSTDPRLLSPIRRIFLGESDWWVRSMAAEALAELPRPEVTDLLLSRIDHPELRYSVISILGKRDDPPALRALLAALSDPERGIRVAALNALSAIKTAEVAGMVARVAEEDPEDAVREKAQTVLAELGSIGQEALERIAAREKRQGERRCEAPEGLEMLNEALNP